MKYTFELTEKQIQNSIIEYLNLSGHFVWRNNTGMMKATDKYGRTRAWRAGIKGSADIIGVHKDGRFLAIECKRPGKKATEIQDYFLLQVKKRGGFAMVAHSFTEVRDEMEGLRP